MTKTIRVMAFGDATLRDSLLGKEAGGEHLDQGLAATVAAAHADYEIELGFHEYGGLSELRATAGEDDTDVIVLSLTPDTIGLASRAIDPHEAIATLHDDMVAVVDQIKATNGAHVLAVNVSTFDPDDETSCLYGLDEEPISMRAHRVDLALLQLSHEIGISIIDVDRITAEAGCGAVVPTALKLSPAGSALVRDETVRVLADYGFFDERSLVAQVGNRGGSK